MMTPVTVLRNRLDVIVFELEQLDETIEDAETRIRECKLHIIELKSEKFQMEYAIKILKGDHVEPTPV